MIPVYWCISHKWGCWGSVGCAIFALTTIQINRVSDIYQDKLQEPFQINIFKLEIKYRKCLEHLLWQTAEGSIYRPVQLQQPADRWRPGRGQHQTHGPAGTGCLWRWRRVAFREPQITLVSLCFGWAGRESPVSGSGGAAGPLSGPGPGADGLQPSGLSWPGLETSRWTRPASGAGDDYRGREI